VLGLVALVIGLTGRSERTVICRAGALAGGLVAAALLGQTALLLGRAALHGGPPLTIP